MCCRLLSNGQLVEILSMVLDVELLVVGDARFTTKNGKFRLQCVGVVNDLTDTVPQRCDGLLS